MLGVQGIVIMWQLVFALCHRLKSNNKKRKRVPDGHGGSFGSRPWQKATSDGISKHKVPSPANVEVQVSDFAEQITDPGIDAPKYKWKHCRADHKSMISLSDHIKFKHPNSQFKCEKCPKKYPLKSQMKRHMTLKHPVPVHPCNICKKLFFTRQGLDAHR